MKVWINTRHGSFSGGMLLVAANSANEAHELCLNSENMEYIYWKDGYEYETGKHFKMPVYNCYKWNEWQEVPNLLYDGVNPCIIAEEGYNE